MNSEQYQAALYEDVKKTALAILDSGKSVHPFALVPTTEGLTGIPLPLAGEKDQQTARDKTRELLAKLAACAPCFCVVTEVWIASFIAGDDRDRREALMVQLYANGQNVCTAQMPFERNGSSVKHGDWQETGSLFSYERPEGSVLPS